MIDAYCIFSIESNLLVLESAVNVLALAFGGRNNFGTKFIFPANFNEAVCIHIQYLEQLQLYCLLSEFNKSNLLHFASHSTSLRNPLLVSPHPLRYTFLQVLETGSNVNPLGHNG